MSSSSSSKVVLTIAGSDCSAGAGIQADLKTAGAFGVFACSVVTAVTAQNTQTFIAANVLDVMQVQQQLDAVLEDFPVAIIKLGMLGSLDNAQLVADYLDRMALPVVIDPVLKSSSGGALCDMPLLEFYRSELCPRASVITPNLSEAAALLCADVAETELEIEEQARALLAYGSEAVLLKGGHAQGERSTDYLASNGGCQVFSSPRISSKHTHGGGCTLAMGIAAGLAQGLSLKQAVAAAKTFIQAAIAQSERLQLVSSNGPIHHFYQYW